MTKESPKESHKEVSYYEHLAAIDVIDPILDIFHKGLMKVDLSKERPFSLVREDVGINRMWTFATVCQDRRCSKWLGIYFKFYRILPPPCLGCFKIVYVPNTIVELIEVQKFQRMLGLPAKCGTEARDYTSGLGGYRAFWYCPYNKGLKFARLYYQRIKNAMIKHFGEDFILAREKQDRLYLKRGCTELERDFGNSDTWDIKAHWKKYQLLETVWEDPVEPKAEFTPLIYTNYKRWIEFAMAHGDLSVTEYIRSKSIGIGAIKYHNSDHEDKNFESLSIPLNEKCEDEDNDDSGDKEGTEKEKDLFELEFATSKED